VAILVWLFLCGYFGVVLRSQPSQQAFKRQQMKEIDEPMLSKENTSEENPVSEHAIGEKSSQVSVSDIRQLVLNQPFGVLCTLTQAQPYGSLVAFAASDSLEQIALSTPMTTRKYHFMKGCPNVAMVIDSRQGPAKPMMEIEAVTAIGVAKEITTGQLRDEWADLLLRQHKYLDGFIAANTCGLFVIEVERYLYVTRFQEVSQWVPNKT
jgi:hypothetical protein